MLAYDRRSSHVVVEGVALEPSRLIVALSETDHNFIFDDWKEVRYVLRNPVRREALIANKHDISVTGTYVLVPFPHTLEIRKLILDFVSPFNGPRIDKVWVQEAELVRTETKRVGRFSKSFQHDDLVLAKLPGPDGRNR